ncbi:MAG TPA: hypothetical protein VHS31_03775 [Tepidisphaeraceae bacterium]|nr:hypothetical protein [Tepidisphaeraceae bacterium]
MERPISFDPSLVKAIIARRKTQTRRIILPKPEKVQRVGEEFQPMRDGKPVACRFGNAGDHLWVRERWSRLEENSQIIYAANDPVITGVRWRPSYVMPRAACRLKLEILDRRAQRLNSITGEDALAEGYEAGGAIDDPILWFRELWDRLSGEENCWKTNPWVWVIGFRVIP